MEIKVAQKKKTWIILIVRPDFTRGSASLELNNCEMSKPQCDLEKLAFFAKNKPKTQGLEQI